jgi:hypothetical protein
VTENELPNPQADLKEAYAGYVQLLDKMYHRWFQHKKNYLHSKDRDKMTEWQKVI